MPRTVDILMPRLSDSMTEGTIVAWLKAPGDTVRMGEDIAEIETDKATMTYGADQAGKLVEIIAQEGDTVALGEPIARMEVDGDEPAAQEPAVEAAEEKAVEAKEAAEQAPAEPAVAQSTPTPTEVPAGERVIASPVARRTAESRGVDLSGIVGSGPGGRIVLSDVEAAAQSTPAAPAPAPAPAPETVAGETRSASRIEKLIARRMVLGKSAPEFPTEREVRIDNIIKMRQEMKQGGMEQVPSINDFIILAAAHALREHPLLRSGWREDNWQADEAEIVTHQDIHIGMAVATETTLLVPVINHADQLKLSQVSAEARQLAGLARDGKLSAEQMEGAVFTISNLGGMGVTRFQAVLVPGQAGILAVGAARPEARWGEDGPEKHTMLSLTLTADHRLVYGAHAAQFMQTLAQLLENPLQLLV